MAFPSRKDQITRIAKFLDADHTEGKELAEVAAVIVDAFADMYGAELKDPPLIPHVGLAFKHPSLSGVWHVAYQEDRPNGRLWLVSATTKYGAWMVTDANFWSYATPSTAKSGAPGNNKNWVVGDLVSRMQRRYTARVVATGDKCVLLASSLTGVLEAESNDNMALYYKRERTEDAGEDW